MKTCDTCRFWCKPSADPDFYGHRDLVAVVGYGNCEIIDWVDEDRPDPTGTPAVLEASAADDTSLCAKLRTKADFGCTMHQDDKRS